MRDIQMKNGILIQQSIVFDSYAIAVNVRRTIDNIDKYQNWGMNGGTKRLQLNRWKECVELCSMPFVHAGNEKCAWIRIGEKEENEIIKSRQEK